MAEEIRLLDAGQPHESDIETINRWVARLNAARAHRARVKLLLDQRMRSLDGTIAYLEQRVAAMAVQWRLDTGEPTIPLTAGQVEVRRRPAKVVADDNAIANAGKLLGLEGDPECYTPPQQAAGVWDRRGVLKRLKFPDAPPEGENSVAAYDPDTGETFDDVRKVWADPGDFTVSIKAGDVSPELLAAIADEA